MCKQGVDSGPKTINKRKEFLNGRTDHSEISLLNNVALSQNKPIETLHKKKIKLNEQLDNRENNLLRVLGNIPKDNAKEAIQSLAAMFSDEMEFLISKLHSDQRTS